MGSSSPPPAPDPYRVSSAEGKSNVQTGIANSVLGNANTVSPFGSTTYSQSGEMQTITLPDGSTTQVPRYTQTTTLSPEQQGLYNLNTQTQQNIGQIGVDQSKRIGNLLGQPIDLSSLPKAAPDDFSADRLRVEQSIRDRLAPQNERDYSALENRLTNQGFQRGTEAFNSAMDEYRRGINDQNLAITAQGLGEQQGMYGMASNARNQALTELLQQRNQPINEISALLSGSQVSLPNQPGYNAPTIAGTNFSQNAYNSAAIDAKNYETKQKANAALMSGLFGLGGTVLTGGMQYGFNPMKWGGG